MMMMSSAGGTKIITPVSHCTDLRFEKKVLSDVRKSCRLMERYLCKRVFTWNEMVQKCFKGGVEASCAMKVLNSIFTVF